MNAFNKSTIKKFLTLTAAPVLLVTGITIAASESASAGTQCHIRTDIPDAANDAYVGRSACSNKISGTGRIKEDRRYMPDDIVGSATFKAGVKKIYGSCGNGVGRYYSEFSSSSGAFGQSARTTTCR